MTLLQRRMIYFPPRDYPVTPADAGLPFEEIDLAAEDGVAVKAWWIEGGKPDAPVAICFHGNATNISGMIDAALAWRAKGLACLLAEYRGYGSSSGRPTEKGLYRDARAAYRWVIGRGARPERIVAYGHSLGAGVAAWLAAEEKVGGLVLEGAFPSVYRMARHHYWWIVTPEFAITDKFRTAEHVSRSRCPLLMIHGEEDVIAPIALGREVFAAAREPKTFVAVPGAGHNSLNLVSRQGSDATAIFLRETVKPRS